VDDLAVAVPPSDSLRIFAVGAVKPILKICQPANPQRKHRQDDPAKIDRFKELARELGATRTNLCSKSALKKLATSGPVPKHEPKKRQQKG